MTSIEKTQHWNYSRRRYTYSTIIKTTPLCFFLSNIIFAHPSHSVQRHASLIPNIYCTGKEEKKNSKNAERKKSYSSYKPMIQCHFFCYLLLISGISSRVLSRHRSFGQQTSTLSDQSDSDSTSNETINSSSSSEDFDDEYYDHYDYDLSGTLKYEAKMNFVFLSLLISFVNFLWKMISKGNLNIFSTIE